jgi:hypothetical protein
MLIQISSENKGLVLNFDVDPRLDTEIPSTMAVSQQARQDAFLQSELQGLHAITHDPGPRSPKLNANKDFSALDNWSPEITAKRRSLSGPNLSTNSPSKPFDFSGNAKPKAKELDDDEVNPEKSKSPEKISIKSDDGIQIIEEPADSKENKPFTDEGTILYEPGVIEEKIEQKIGRVNSPDKSEKIEFNNTNGLGTQEQGGEIQPLEGLMIQENKAVILFASVSLIG